MASAARNNSKPGRHAISRDQIYTLLRDNKWMIALSLFLAGVFYIPGQIHELYRTIIGDIRLVLRDGHAISSVLDGLSAALPLLAISFFVTLGTYQVTAESLSRIRRPTQITRLFARWLSPILGAIPLFACAMAQFVAAPSRLSDEELSAIPVGSRLEKLDAELAQEVGTGLLVSGGVLLFLVFVFVFAALKWGDVHRRFAQRTNEVYFFGAPFILMTIVLIAAVTALFIAMPVMLPQILGVFGVTTIFVLSVAGFLIHFSLLSIRDRLPYIPAIFALAVIAALFDWNDNHAVRTVYDPLSATGDPAPTIAKRSSSERLSAADTTAEDEFRKWYESRDDLAAFEEYPVYIVTAQGGGIYAAYQSAIFLARLQDYCPAFAHHLFAISSVSGGSVGAATFAAALRESIMKRPAGPKSVWLSDPCPRISEYFSKAITPKQGVFAQAGDLEPQVKKVLSADFLSPLVAATLFQDFTQRFVPYPIPIFDRARALEFAFEDATANLAPNDINPFTESFLDMRDAKKADMPALLMNTTDAATGRRVLLAPFRVEPQPNDGCGSQATAKAGSIVHFQSLGQLSSGGPRPLDVSLSTAALMSARFPWVTPAATVPVADGRFKPSDKLRLVDGGYVDNSGVETALDLIECLAAVQKEIAGKAKNNVFLRDGTTPYKRIRFHLIVLSGGDFPARNSFAFGETMEPIRTLLSTRSSRAYVAIERATRTEDILPYPIPTRRIGGQDIKITAARLKRTNLNNRFYDMPLGWTMSKRTQSIIEEQSGNFWDCDPDTQFTQRLGNQAIESDCVQLLVYHELSRSLASAAEVVAVTEKFKQKIGTGIAARPARVDHQSVMRCYRDKALPDIGPAQASSLETLLDVWDEHPEWHDERWLAYMIGTVLYESGDLRSRYEPLSFSAERIQKIWPNKFATVEEALPFANNPRALADKVYENRIDLGNTEPGDGWRYRGRGMIAIVGRENYREYGKAIGIEGLDLEEYPDLALIPAISARLAFAIAFPPSKINRLAPYFDGPKEDWLNARKAINDGRMTGAKEVEKKSKDFHECIKQSKERQTQPSKLSPRL